MVALVTVEQVNNRLRLSLEGDLDDPSYEGGDVTRLDDVEGAIEEATSAVLDYLKIDEQYVEWTVETVPAKIRAAILLVIKSFLDDQAKAAMLAGLAEGDLKNPVVGLLYRSRDPSIA